MNIQQFQYVLALEEHRHFETAANNCFVTQSTLSTMINRFEDEIGIKIFNRKTKPVSITKEGLVLIERLKIINNEIDFLDNVIQELKGEMTGELRIGIIPTIAPYLLPAFLPKFANEFPKVKMIVEEMTTAEIQKALKLRSLDIGVLATPLEDTQLVELDLYTEPFCVFDCRKKDAKSRSIALNDLDFSKLWLLQEGHCLTTQVQQICDLSNNSSEKKMNFEFKAGSLDSLIRFTKAGDGITILPFLTTLDLSEEDKENVIPFSSPKPVRTIGLVTHQHFVKKRLFNRLQDVIKQSVESIIPISADEMLIKPLVK